jgi:TetR/AcrR family transcriptional regulator of autoinduction and epiphytic fitness
VQQRGWVQDMLAATPCQRVLALAVEHGVDIFVRAAPLWPAVAEAAGDPFVARYWRDVAAERRAGQARMVAKLAELDEHRATDIVVVLFGHDGYRRLVGEASWSVPEYKTWLLTLVQQLCIGPS